MIKVLIADDEYRICRLIKKLVDWDHIGMTVIGTASNGVETLDMIKGKNPDIVITDIRMPGYDGLEMIERAKRIDENLNFIIISGYSYFEYAKKAINFGVKDYLLKPINKEELLEVLMRIRENIKETERYRKIEAEYKEYVKKNVGDSKVSVDILARNANTNTIQIKQAKEYIDANYMNNITLDDLGEYVGLSPSYFSSIFKKEMGISFIEYLSMVRIEKAKDLLKEADLQIQDISIMVGYYDVKYFSRLFAKHTGLQPREYRKMFV